jgi:hypothetical protein
MSINAWKTSFIGINKPPKVLSGSADGSTPVAFWPYANDVTDTYWSGGSNPQPYQWQVSFTIAPINHGSNLTRTPYYFTANDIEVGDFVAGAADGKVLEIMSIISKVYFLLLGGFPVSISLNVSLWIDWKNSAQVTVFL